MSIALRVSIGANLLLAGAVALLLWRGTPAPRVAGTVLSKPAEPRRGPAVLLDSGVLPTKTAERSLSQDSVTKLEQLGVAHETLVNVVLEDCNRRLNSQVFSLQKKYAPRQVPDRAMKELLRQHEAEQARELKEAFGEEGYRAWEKQQALASLNRARPPGDELTMSAAEAEQAYQYQKRFDEVDKELQQALEDGVADKADVSALRAKAQQALDGQLQDLLGQERFGELRGNVDPTTEVYRTYGDLNPTPAQAKAVLQAQQAGRDSEAALAAQLGDSAAAPADLAAQLKSLKEAQEASLRSIFGAAAYDAAKRQSDPAYSALKLYAETWNLNEGDIQPVYETIRTFQTDADCLRSAADMKEAAGQRVNWREVDAAIEQLRQKTESGLQALIGSDRVEKLKQNELLDGRR